MSEHDPDARGAQSDALDAVTSAARTAWRPDSGEVKAPDWEAIEAKLFARIDQTSLPPAPLPDTARRPLWLVPAAALGIAAAAAAVFALRSDDTLTASTTTPRPVAGEIRGGAHVRIDGISGHAGDSLRIGALVETGEHEAVMSGHRSDPESGTTHVSWLLEPRARVRLQEGGERLTLALEAGALEADVESVRIKEGFAVDADTVRVAVHGTHLRVARQERELVVDLTEGVVAIGEAGSVAPLRGEEIKAPAHIVVPLDGHGHGAKVDRSADHVRRARALARAGIPRASRADSTRSGQAAHASKEAHASGEHGKPAAHKRTAAKTVAPEARLGAAVRRCIIEHMPQGSVRVVVDTSARVETDRDGRVRALRFNPPVHPSAQRCAADALRDWRADANTTFEASVHVEP